MRRKARRTTIAENFFAHCDLSGGPDACWPYLRSKNRLGYGRVWVDGRCHEAHRHAYSLVKGPIPQGDNGKSLLVLHDCDNPSCCNPAHLKVGTHQDNANDRESRNRGNQPKGERNAHSKLTTKDVVFIRRCRDIYNTSEMARMLGVNRSLIAKVLCGEQWAWVTPELGLSDDRAAA
jgi:hypothetical protein